MDAEEYPQLHMVWPKAGTVSPSDLAAPPGYTIRTYVPGDEDSFLRLAAVQDGFAPFDEAKLHYNMARIIPDGWFFATAVDTHAVCGTAMCLHNYKGNQPFTGDLGWLVCSPSARGHGLGACLAARVTQRFADAGYSRIQLHTEHYRLAAIKTYLKIGYIPVVASERVYNLWMELCSRLNWEFTPDEWEQADAH